MCVSPFHEHLILSVKLEQVDLIDSSQSRLLPDLKHTGSWLRRESKIKLSMEDNFRREGYFALSFRQCNHEHQQHLEKGEAKILLFSQSQVAQGGSW